MQHNSSTEKTTDTSSLSKQKNYPSAKDGGISSTNHAYSYSPWTTNDAKENSTTTKNSSPTTTVSKPTLDAQKHYSSSKNTSAATTKEETNYSKKSTAKNYPHSQKKSTGQQT